MIVCKIAIQSYDSMNPLVGVSQHLGVPFVMMVKSSACTNGSATGNICTVSWLGPGHLMYAVALVLQQRFLATLE